MARWALVALNLLAFLLTGATYFSFSPDTRPLPYRYFQSAFGTAITALRGIAADGTASRELVEYFQSRGAAVTNGELQAALTMTIERPDDRTVVFESDDQGLFRFVEASFALFGVNLSAPHKMFFLLLAVGSLVFVLTYSNEPVALLLSFCSLLAIYATVFVLFLSSQLWTAIDGRFISVLAFIPCLHLCLAAATRRWSASAIAAVVLQCVLMAVVYQIRSSAAWSLICVVVVGCCSAGSMLVTAKSWRLALNALVPALMLIACTVSVTQWHRSRLAGQFQTTVQSRHVIWHGLHVGLGTHPELARQYRLSLDDEPVYKNVFKYFANARDENTLRAVFGGNGQYDYRTIRWRQYDEATRTVVIQMIRDHPRQVLEAFVYYKPLMFLRTLRWARGVPTPPVEALGMSPQWLTPDDERRRNDGYLRLFRPLALALYVVGLACYVGSSQTASATLISFGRGAAVMGAMFLTALLPGLAVYPAFHWVADGIVAWCALVYVAIALVIEASRPSSMLHGTLWKNLFHNRVQTKHAIGFRQ